MDAEIQKFDEQAKQYRKKRNIAIIATIVAILAHVAVGAVGIVFPPAIVGMLGTGAIFMTAFMAAFGLYFKTSDMERRRDELKNCQATMAKPAFAEFLKKHKVERKEFTIDELLQLNSIFNMQLRQNWHEEALAKLR